ncbi:MAG: hypothetical protein KDA36_00865, partial [Planctomycetaceae bacterium]|nr:hypothetical protein [Planctomycetaceae bacterium]
MGRRRQSQELEFGSDSFLDVIANTVGIIIILIVITGLRVSHAPVVLPPPSSGPPLVADNPLPETTIDEEPEEENLPDPAILSEKLARLRQEEEFLRKRITTTEKQQAMLET